MDNRAYKTAGVDLEASQEVKRRIGAIAARTHGREVLAGVGAFGAMYAFGGYADPVLVASTDPVGTKLKLAAMTGRWEGVGADLVNACVNDVIVCGAKPILFLDYINMSALRADVVVALVEGMARACEAVGCALIGGETAEMPGVFADGALDVSGFVLGAVERAEIIDGSRIAAGDALIGVASNGLHTNGYSLVRAVYGFGRRPVPAERIPRGAGRDACGRAAQAASAILGRPAPRVRRGEGDSPYNRRRADRERPKNPARRLWRRGSTRPRGRPRRYSKPCVGTAAYPATKCSGCSTWAWAWSRHAPPPARARRRLSSPTRRWSARSSRMIAAGGL